MQRKDLARGRADDIWVIFEPILPAKVWFGNGRPPCGNRECLHALLYVLASGISWEFLPWCFPSDKTVQRRRTDWLREDAFLRAWRQRAERYEQLHGINWDQVLLDGSKKPSKKGVRRRGRVRSIAASRVAPPTERATREPCRWPSPSPRPGRATGARRTRVRAALVVRPPASDRPTDTPDDRGRPTARADGAYGNGPSRDRAASQGFRLQAPSRGKKRPGVGTVRNAVERCHNFRAQFGRVGRRLDRTARHDLGWCQLAARVIFIRSGFVR